MLKKLLSLSFGLVGLGLVAFAALFLWITFGPLFQRNTLSMLNGPYLDQKRLLGPNAKLDSVSAWEWKVPLVIAIPKRTENCSASKTLQEAARLELIAVDTLCNVTAHPSTVEYVVHCLSPFQDEQHLCFASAYLGGVQMRWERKTLEEGHASVGRRTVWRELTPLLALDPRVNKLATEDIYSRALNGAFNQTAAENRQYVIRVNEGLSKKYFSQLDSYEYTLPYVWSFSREEWIGGNLDKIPNRREFFTSFQEKFQIGIATQ